MAKRAKRATTKKPIGKKKAKKPKVKPAIKAGSKKKKAKKKAVKKKAGELRVVRPRRVATREYILEKFRKRGKKPPVRYRRSVPKGMVKVGIRMKNRKVETGYIVEFKYGFKQKTGQVGGWKNDPRPVMLCFHDDKIKYIEGINTNYLSEWYLKKIRTIMKRFPGVDGEQLYRMFKRTAKAAIKKGYRKYMRESFRDVYLYVYENDLERTLDELAKQTQSKYGTADKSNNAEL
jgi:hypothetical protein